MKILKKINNTYLSSFLILILVATSIFFLPDSSVYAGTGDPPTLTINSPTANTLLYQTNVVISGTYNGIVQQSSDLKFTAYDNLNGNDLGEISDSGEWNLSNIVKDGTWTFTKTFLDEGTHIITIKINDTLQSSVSFTIDTKRPYVSGTSVVLSDNTKQNGEDLTSIPPDAKIRFTVADDKEMTQLVSKIRNTSSPYNPIKVILGSEVNIDKTPPSGTTVIEDKGIQSGKHVYEITFTPSNLFSINQTYFAYLDTGVKDDSNGPVYAKFFKFTTKTNVDWDDPDDKNHSSSNPHGHYMLNTNMCASCHSTHVDSPYDNINTDNKLTPSREGGSYLLTFNDKLKGNPSKNYCMACHDGTTNAPAIDGITSTYHHDKTEDNLPNETNNLKEADSCTSCHNPHLEWSEKNPNLMKDHYVYTHKNADQGKMGLTSLVVDSLDTSCSACHQDNLIHDDSTNTVTSIFNSSSDKYQILSYKKSLTAEGANSAKATNPTENTVSDYALCLRCHTANKSNSNIEQYYVSQDSKHSFTLPSEDGGSNLKGSLPCAECHDTHGSNNIKMLRTQLGNVHITDPAKMFTSSGTNWNAGNERMFCLTCHNQSTELYGKTAVTFDTTRTEHKDSNQACSDCHNDQSKPNDTFIQRSMSAAHAPHTGHASQGN